MVYEKGPRQQSLDPSRIYDANSVWIASEWGGLWPFWQYRQFNLGGSLNNDLLVMNDKKPKGPDLSDPVYHPDGFPRTPLRWLFYKLKITRLIDEPPNFRRRAAHPPR